MTAIKSFIIFLLLMVFDGYFIWKKNVIDSLPSPTPQSNPEVSSAASNTIPHVPATAPVSSTGLYSPLSSDPPSSSRLYSSPPTATSETTPSQQQNGLELRRERVYVTLLRDHTGLGFGIGGGKGGSPFKDGSDVSWHTGWYSSTTIW